MTALLALLIAHVPSVGRAATVTPRVVFLLDEPLAVVGALQAFDTLRGQLGELDLTIDITHVTWPEPLDDRARLALRESVTRRAQAAFWFSSHSDGTVRVCALHVSSGRVYGRDIELGGNVAIQREQLSVVLRAAIAAVLERGGADLGEPLLVLKPLPPDEPTNKGEGASHEAVARRVRPAAAPTRSAITPVRTGVAYRGTMLGNRSTWQSGFVGELMWRSDRWWCASLGGGYAFETPIRGDGATAWISRIPLFARIGAGTRFGSLGLAIEAGAAFERWFRRTEIQSATLEPTASATTWRGGAALAVRIDVTVQNGFGLYVLGEAQWFPFLHRMRVQTPDGSQLLPTSAILPHLGLGAFFDLPFPTFVARTGNFSRP